jgi:hypothetical protein
MNEVFGLPAHPLLVHVPVVLLPLALIGVVLILIRPQWKSALLVPTAVLGGAGAIGAILASQAGEWLQERVPETALIDQHQQLGEMARNLSILFAGALFVWVVRELLIDRGILKDSSLGKLLTPLLSPKWIGAAAAAGALIFGSLTTVWVVRAGHTGAKAAWKGRVSNSPHGTRGG